MWVYYRYSVFLVSCPLNFLKIGTCTGVHLIDFWQGWEFAFSLLTLSLFFLRSFAQRVTVSKSLMSLFKKKQLCANCSSCTLLKTRVSDLLFFTSKLLFRLQKTSDSQIKLYFFVCFWHFLTVFPFLSPKANCSRCS